RRKSQSIIRTSAPVCASINAVLIAVVVFPSEGWLDVTRIVFGGCPAEESRSEVRRWRYASAMGERTSLISASAVVSFASDGPWWPLPLRRGRWSALFDGI